MARGRQIPIAFPCGWGGVRKGAGRKRVAERKRIAHRTRPVLDARKPVHVTVRLGAELPRLRGRKPAQVLRRAFVRGCDKGVFRICQFSIQGNHIHLVCEADTAAALAMGIKAWKTRVTRGLNRLWRRSGTVWDDRYHVQLITSLRQLRNTLVYVLHNARHHRERLPRWAQGTDPYSSACYFTGWRNDSFPDGAPQPDRTHATAGRPVAQAHTWFLNTGWRRHGLIGLSELPP
jgi:putative transposase